MHKQQGWPQAWEYTRSGLKQDSLHQESPRSDIFRKRTTKPLLKQKHYQKHLTWDKEKRNWTVAQWSEVLFSDESKFCISFGNQGPRVWRKCGEAQNPCCLKSSVKFLQSVMIWAAMSSAGVGPLCFLKSTVNAAMYQENLEHFMLPSADKLYGDADFIFQQDFWEILIFHHNLQRNSIEFFFSYFVSHSWGIPMMKITGLSHLFKWENLHNWWLTKYFFAPLYIYPTPAGVLAVLGIQWS